MPQLPEIYPDDALNHAQETKPIIYRLNKPPHIGQLFNCTLKEGYRYTMPDNSFGEKIVSQVWVLDTEKFSRLVGMNLEALSPSKQCIYYQKKYADDPYDRIYEADIRIIDPIDSENARIWTESRLDQIRHFLEVSGLNPDLFSFHLTGSIPLDAMCTKSIRISLSGLVEEQYDSDIDIIAFADSQNISKLWHAIIDKNVIPREIQKNWQTQCPELVRDLKDKLHLIIAHKPQVGRGDFIDLCPYNIHQWASL